jgi:raffinose/stachyose/melibiose transport system substrate-binding protein
MLNKRLGILAVATALAITGCSSPGSDTASETNTADAINSPVTVEEVAALGDITLDVWGDAGEERTMKLLIPQYEAMYPNVKVNLTLKGFDDLMKTVVPALAGDPAPDVVQGNQGYAVDGALIKGGLIRKLTDVSKAYNWADSFNSDDFGQFSWSEDGSQYGAGELYGMSWVGEFVGIFYNKAKLAKLGIALPKTFDEFAAALEKAKKAGETPIVLGNSDKWPATHVFGLIQGAFTPAAETKDFITGQPGSSFVSSTNETALNTLRDWIKKGYFTKGFDGVSADDATAKFAAGEGLFYMGGTWFGETIGKGLGKDAGFIANPPGASGKHVATGSYGLGWHISSKTDALPASVAFVAMLMDPAFAPKLASLDRIPSATATLEASSPLLKDMQEAGKSMFKDAGLTFYVDWATDTMYDVYTAKLQEFMAGRIKAPEMMKAVQDNWETFQKSRSK